MGTRGRPADPCGKRPGPGDGHTQNVARLGPKERPYQESMRVLWQAVGDREAAMQLRVPDPRRRHTRKPIQAGKPARLGTKKILRFTQLGLASNNPTQP